MKIFHIVKIRFDVRRADITQEWLEARYSFFQEYTLRSLAKQTNKDWILWINCQDGMQRNNYEQIQTLMGICTKFYRETGIKVCYSFGDERIIPNTCGMDVIHKLHDSSYVYITRIDSDDLYSNQALELVANVKPQTNGRTEACMFKLGYKYNVLTGEKGAFFNHSCVFHTLMIPTMNYIDSEKYNELWYKVGDHSKIHSHLYIHQLPDWNFTVLVHAHNFSSDFDYSRKMNVYIPKNFSANQFIDNPIVFDVDDFCDEYNCLEDLLRLKRQYPKFKCTLFTIPNKISDTLLKQAKNTGFIELCPHGISHEPTQELKNVREERLISYLSVFNQSPYKELFTKGFRPPGWYIEERHIKCLTDFGYWIALHRHDVEKFREQCTHGYYACGERYQYHHAHTHDVCNNWIHKDLQMLLKKWDRNQEFAYVSDATMVKQ